MARSAFEQVIELQLKRFSPEEAKRRHIAIARQGLASFMSRQESKPTVAIETDGRPATSENSVRPFGVITYRFLRMREVARFARDEAIRLSPEKSGRYKRSWFLMVDRREMAAEQIPHTAAMILLTNDTPYSRKIHVRGARLENVPPGIVERVRQLVLRKYRTIITAEIRFITLGGGYQLKGRSRRRRKDTAPGRALTYPAIEIKPRV